MPKVTGEELLRLMRDTKKIQLRGGYRLSESSSKLGALRPGKLPTNATQAIKFEVKVEKEKNQATARIAFRLILAYDGPEDAEPPVLIAASFVIQYDITKSFPKRRLEQSLRNIAILGVWPYWREFVQSMIQRMGLPSFAVPLLNVADLQGDHKEDESEQSS